MSMHSKKENVEYVKCQLEIENEKNLLNIKLKDEKFIRKFLKFNVQIDTNLRVEEIIRI